MANPERVIEVQMEEDRFRELLTSIFDDRTHSVEGDKIRIGGEQYKTVEVTLHQQPERHLGSLELPMEKIRFEFIDQSEEEADAFMETYREHAMRPAGM